MHWGTWERLRRTQGVGQEELKTKSGGIFQRERKQQGELHSSTVWPPDVYLRLSRGCLCWLSACSGCLGVQICCLRGVWVPPKLTGLKEKLLLSRRVHEQLLSFSCTVGFSWTGRHSLNETERATVCSRLEVVWGRHYEMNLYTGEAELWA